MGFERDVKQPDLISEKMAATELLAMRPGIPDASQPDAKSASLNH
jgi:hypothetical protein